MLIRAQYKGDKVVATHGADIAPIAEYAKELRKDDSNGWTKNKTMRLVWRGDNVQIENYKRDHPGWWEEVSTARDKVTRDRLWQKFLLSPYANQTLTVDKLKHDN